MKKVLMTALFPALLSAVALNVQAAEEAALAAVEKDHNIE